mgnify:CR=1 FL=1
MSTKVQLRRGNTAQTAVFTGAVAEITVDTDKNVVVVHDGITAGGHPLTLDTKSQSAFDKANSAFGEASSSYDKANSAFDAANGDLSLIASELTSNVEFIAAVNATQNTNITYVISHANAAYEQANTSLLYAATAYYYSGEAYTQSNSAIETANIAAQTVNEFLANSNTIIRVTGGTLNGPLLFQGNVDANLAIGNIESNDAIDIYSSNVGSSRLNYSNINITPDKFPKGNITENYAHVEDKNPF